jgi:PAS domain S-box-containing protein
MATEQAGEITVLYVDPEPDRAGQAVDHLEREDDRISVRTATGAPEGLEQLSDADIDCIVSDYDMPEQSGLAFLETVREDHPDLPLILYTGKGSEEVASEAIDAGVTGYLQRESDTDHHAILANRIVNAVERNRTARELAKMEERSRTIEQELTELSIDLLETEGCAIGERIEEALQRIGTLADADRSYVFQIDQEAGTLSNTHEWCAEGVEPQIDALQDIPRDTFPWWMQKLENFENITIQDVAELPPEAEAEQEALQEQNVQSLVVVPMVSDDELIGFIGFDWVDRQDAWSEEFIDLLRMVGKLVTSALKRETRRRELERHEAYLEQSSDIISVVNADGTVRFQSRSTERMTGFSPAEVIGNSGFEHVHPDDREEVMDQFSSFVANPGEKITSELRIQTKDGSWRWIEVRGVNKLEDPAIEGLLFSSREITERKEREREIQQLKKRLELAVDGAEIGIWDWDLTTDEVEFNEQWAEMLGYSLEDIESHLDAWEKRVHPDDLEAVKAALDAHVTEETAYYDTEHRMRTAEGEWKWIRDIGKVVDRNEEGEPVRAVGIHLDIDERKNREQELQQLRKAVEQTAHAVYITDTDGTIEFVNSAFEEVTGYSEEEALGETPRILKSGEYDEEYYEEFWETLHSGEQWKQEMIDKQADGEKIVLNQSISPITDEDGDPQKFVAVAQDITGRKEYEQELERSREELRKIIDLVPDLIFAKNREGKYLLANEKTAETYGLSPEEVEGKQESEVIPNVEDSEQFREDDREVIETGEPKFIPEEELTTADGETRILETTKIPYEIPGSGDDAILGYGRDITERKEYERELEAQRDNLEVLNQIVRHDIRNNLQIVSAYAETLENSVDNSGEESIEKILEASRDAVEMTETARDVTAVMLQSDTEPSPVSLRHVLEGEIDDVRSNYEQALIRVDGSVPDVDVTADDMLKSVFRNLLGNAIQHNDKQIPEVLVSASIEDETVLVEIADNGPGIPDDRKPAIFKEGERSLDSTGTGLGLYLTDTLVDRYGGDIRVEDNEPDGAVFAVTLQVAE